MVEALSLWPYSHFLLEPHLGKNYLAVKANEAARLREIGVDLRRFARWRLPLAFLLRRLRPLGLRQDYFVGAFKRELLPQLLEVVQQVGVKEIKHMGWQNYVRHFPDLKVIMLGRDPRDMYTSYFDRWRQGGIAWRGAFTPESHAAFLQREFAHQLALREHADCMILRYEDLCTDPSVLDAVRKFVDSPIPRLGTIGAFLSASPARHREHVQHGDRITRLSVGRWRREDDTRLRADAERFLELVPGYVDFWGYVTDD